MIYSNTSELVKILKGEKLWAQKKLGQNFLVNQEALKKIIATAELTPQDYILEVGPGLGILTEQLARHSKKVTAIEIDSEIIPVLRKNLLLENINNVEILNQDALKTTPPAEPYKLIANIPYYITSPLLNHFLQATQPPQLIVLLVQKEVAEKICSKPGDHSVLSLQVQVFGEPSVVFHVSKSSFFPQPKVDSAVIKIKPYAQPKITDTDTFFRLIKAAFQQKRKMLSNSLTNALKLNAQQAEQLFEIAHVAKTERPQKLSLDQWEALIQAYKKVAEI